MNGAMTGPTMIATYLAMAASLGVSAVWAYSGLHDAEPSTLFVAIIGFAVLAVGALYATIAGLFLLWLNAVFGEPIPRSAKGMSIPAFTMLVIAVVSFLAAVGVQVFNLGHFPSVAGTAIAFHFGAAAFAYISLHIFSRADRAAWNEAQRLSTERSITRRLQKGSPA
jgi:hypothetical protein